MSYNSVMRNKNSETVRGHRVLGWHPFAIRPLALLLASSTTFLAGCGWVDSTGRESNSAPVTRISFDDGQANGANELVELESLILSADSTDDDGVVANYSWIEQPIEQGALSQCASAPNFDMSIAAESLSEACADGAACNVSFVQESGSAEGTVEFRLTAPKLRAPIGLTYQLNATDNDGGVGTQSISLCLIAVNEAPTAEDDTYTVLEGESLVVSAADRGLLRNDSDDDHVLNQPLQVLTVPKTRPAFASAFSLRADGGFTYVPAPSRISSTATDTFEYYLSDGVFDSSFASVTIRIVARNDLPEQTADIPPLEATVGIDADIDLNDYFSDPEGDTLSYAITAGALPRSGALTLNSNGVLSGAAEAFDEGQYSFDMVVSDGSGGIEARVELAVLANEPVQAVSIPAQAAEVGVAFSLDVSDSFTDPEGQALTYSVDSTFSDATLSMNARTGVLTADFEDEGSYTVDVSASDGVNTASSIRFVVIVTSDNRSPIFLGAITNQTVEVGESISPISGRFSDPDGDDLDISVAGTLPPGITLSNAGVLSGRPTRAGVYSGIRLIATDPFNKFIRSNAFTIRVLP